METQKQTENQGKEEIYIYPPLYYNEYLLLIIEFSILKILIVKILPNVCS